MSLLTDGQATELHKALIGYLVSIDASRCADILREELNLEDTFPGKTVRKYARILEQKWTTTALLHRKIMKLEAEKDRLQSELTSISRVVTRPTRDTQNWLPSDPRYILQSHRAAVTCIAFHPVHHSLASGSEDCNIKIWDWEFGELERTLKGHSQSVTDLDFGGQKGMILLASSSDDLTIRIWDPSNEYAHIRTLVGHDLPVTSIRYLRSDGNFLASASRDASIRVWDVSTGYCVKTILTGSSDWIYSLGPSFDGKWLLAGGRGQDAKIWDVESGEVRASLLGHDNFIECCIFAPVASYQYLAALAGMNVVPSSKDTAQFVATSGRDKTVRLWNTGGRLIKTLIGHDSWVQDLIFHPGGRYLLSVGDDCTIRCWDLSQDGRLVKIVEETHRGFVTCIRWAPELPNLEANVRDSAARGMQCVIGTGSRDACVRIFK